MIFAAYKKGKIIKNSHGESISTLDSRTIVEAPSYKEALEKAYALGLQYVSRTRLNNIADLKLVFTDI